MLVNTKPEVTTRGNLNNRDGQPDSTPVDKYHFIGLKKAFDFTVKLNYGGPLYQNLKGRGVYKVRWLPLSVT